MNIESLFTVNADSRFFLPRFPVAQKCFGKLIYDLHDYQFTK